MRKRAKIAVASVAAGYALMGLAFAEGLKSAIPAVSVAGAVYAGATWPVWVNGSPIRPPIPDWCFDFPAQAEGGRT